MDVGVVTGFNFFFSSGWMLHKNCQKIAQVCFFVLFYLFLNSFLFHYF